MASMASRTTAATSGSVVLFSISRSFVYVCHAIHANGILINFFAAAPARHNGASYRRLGACAVTDFVDALHGTSACNAALHGCLKGVGLARQCLPFSRSMHRRVFAASRPGVVGFPLTPVAFLLPPIADPSLPAAANNLRGTAGNTDCHTGAACSNSLRTGRRGLHVRGRHQQCRACTCQSIVDACMRGFGKPAQLPTWCR